MGLRSILVTIATGVVAVPAVVVGVDSVERWSPLPSTIAERVAAATDLDAYLAAREDSVAGVKRADRKGIRWHDSKHKSRTPIALVYLHGFRRLVASFRLSSSVSATHWARTSTLRASRRTGASTAKRLGR